MNKYILFISSLFLLFAWRSSGQICATSAYIPGGHPRQAQQNAAGNYLILSNSGLIELLPDLVSGQTFLPSYEYVQYLQETEDSYLLAGHGKNAGSSLVWSAMALQKSTKQGEVLWYQHNIESALEYNEVICTGFGVIDTTGAMFIASRRRIYRLDAVGNAFDTVSVAAANMDEFTFVARAANGDFVALARKYSTYDHWQAYQVRFDSALNFQSSKIVPFAGESENAYLSVQAVLPNGDWLLLGSLSGGQQILRLDATGDVLWKQENIECVPGSPCAAYIASLVPIGDYIWRMEVTADQHPHIVRCTADGEVTGLVDIGPYNSMYGELRNAVLGTAPNEVLLTGYEQIGTPSNYTFPSIAILLHCENTTGYNDDKTIETAIVSPNPAQQSFSVQLPTAGDYRLSLHDAMGKYWKNYVFNSESAVIDCTELPDGLYFLSIEEKGGAVYRNVVVVTH